MYTLANMQESIKKVEMNAYIIDGARKLDDINDALGTELDSEAYDSIAGLILEQLNRIPKEGDEVTLEGGITLKVNKVEKNRIRKVRVILPDKEEVAEEEQ